MKLPLLISVPHTGRSVPDEVRDFLRLTDDQIISDSDWGADQIYWPLEELAASLLTTEVARAVVDLNRAPDDIGKDGAVKTHTFSGHPIWKEPLSLPMIRELLDKYHEPYHRSLTESSDGLILGVDCHTMSSVGPPFGPDPGQPRSKVCLSNQDGLTCPDEWLDWLADSFRGRLNGDVAINEPFKGGYIVRSQYRNIPWFQIEISREKFCSLEEKSAMVKSALRELCDKIGA